MASRCVVATVELEFILQVTEVTILLCSANLPMLPVLYIIAILCGSLIALAVLCLNPNSLLNACFLPTVYTISD